MDRELRALFNRHYDDALYRRVCDAMRARCREPEFGFRLAELPLILPRDLRERCEAACREILVLIERPEVIAAGERAIPPQYHVPGTDARPHFLTVDLAIVRGDGGRLEPKLVELQAFSSLYGMQLVQGEIWGEALASLPGMPERWTPCFSGPDHGAYVDLLRRTVVAGADPDEVVLLDYRPEEQKTRPDFHVIRDLLGVRSVCVTEIVRRGRRLYAPKDGTLVRVARIFDRVVFDEIDRKGIVLPFDFREDLDVRWVAHPNWYWIWSKATLPLLDHPAVPKTLLLDEVDPLPDDLSRWILKPLFSFAGTGVEIDVDRDRIASIPREERSRFILQEKVAYAPDLIAPDGSGVKAEIRMMFLRPEGARDLELAINLARLSRGKMHGVDHNRGLEWVGSSVAIWPVT